MAPSIFKNWPPSWNFVILEVTLSLAASWLDMLLVGLTTEKCGKYDDAKLTHIFHGYTTCLTSQCNMVCTTDMNAWHNTHEYCQISFCVIHVAPLSEFLI